MKRAGGLLLAHQAQLNALGHTDNGPAYWWWEWGISRKGVANGQGTKTPRQGPAASAGDVALKWTLAGLDDSQTYYFRACGQDQVAGSSAKCGRIYDFGTAPGDSLVYTLPQRSLGLFGSPDVQHHLTVRDGTSGGIDQSTAGPAAATPSTPTQRSTTTSRRAASSSSS